MIQVKRTRTQKRRRALLIAAAALALLIGVYFLLSALLKPEDTPDPEKDPITVDEALGESVYNNTAVSYPYVATSDIDQIDIVYPSTAAGTTTYHHYAFVRNGQGTMILFFYDEQGNANAFLPDVVIAGSDFDYSDLYAIDTNDGLNMVPKLTKLMVACGVNYFSERIALPEDDGERAEFLKDFGIEEGKTTTLTFSYDADEEGNGTKAHRLAIGEKSVTGSGYYYMVDDRNYLYYTGSDYLDFACTEAATFINPRIVAKGLTADKAFEPFLTPDFRQLKNTVNDIAGSPIDVASELVLKAATRTPLAEGAKITAGGNMNGYVEKSAASYTFDLATEARLAAILSGKTLGDYSSSPIHYTVSSDMRAISFRNDEGEELSELAYRYEITAIEAILTDNAEIFTEGTALSAYPTAKIVVTYNSSKNGESRNIHPIGDSGLGDARAIHGVLDLADERLPEALVTSLLGEKTGTLAAPISFDVTYKAEDTDNLRTVGILFKQINAIYNSKGAPAATAEDGCYVSYCYYTVIDGKKSETLYYDTIQIGKNEDETVLAIERALKGKKAGPLDAVTVETYRCHTEYFEDFTTYEIRELSYCVSSEEVVAFRFVNASERDPYYGESFYMNTMSSEKRFYGLNTAACEATVKKLGGYDDTNEQNSANQSYGMLGYETVKVGLNTDVLKEYGLYDYTVVFALPRGISSFTVEGKDGADDLDDYSWTDVLTFVLHVSEKKFDPEREKFFRYVASELFDTVVKIDADELVFLDYSFEDFYARRALIMMDVTKVDSIEAEFSMDDVSGDYLFDLTHHNMQIAYVNTPSGTELRRYAREEDVPEGESASPYDFIDIAVTAKGDCTDNAFTEYLKSYEGTEAPTLAKFYKDAINGGKMVYDRNGLDHIATANFKELFSMIYTSFYAGRLSEDDKAAMATDTPIFSLTLKIDGANVRYRYDFYRVSDRRVAVLLTQISDVSGTTLGSVSEFYVSSYTFKRYAEGFLAILNGRDFVADEPYSGEQ